MGVKSKAMAGTLAASLIVSTPLIGKWEGKRNDPYYDMVKVQTVCYGETRVKMRRYTDAECMEMLKKATAEFAEPVLDMTQTLVGRPMILAAVTSLSYNIGINAYKTSTARKKFLAGDFEGGCKAMLNWNKTRQNGKLVTTQGLVNRRMDEYKLCTEGVKVGVVTFS